MTAPTGDYGTGSYDVVVPAGGTISPEYAAVLGTPFRALAPIGPDGRVVLQIVVNALRESGTARRIICVAPDPVREAVTGVDVWLPAGANGPQNILAGLAQATLDAPALVCASDLPLLTAGAVSDFVARCRPDAEVAVGLVTAARYNAHFPDAPPSAFVRLADMGPVTMGGLFRVHPRLLVRRAALFDRMFAGRKSQARMAGLLGPRLLWQWATRALRLRALTARAERLLGGPVQAVPDVSPLLAYDIDTADDYTYAQTTLRQRRTVPPP